jgi:hypothetical protein
MISGKLGPGREIGYIRWWHEHPLDLSNRMEEVWAISARRIRKEARLEVQPDIIPNSTEARGVCPFLESVRITLTMTSYTTHSPRGGVRGWHAIEEKQLTGHQQTNKLDAKLERSRWRTCESQLLTDNRTLRADSRQLETTSP